MSEQPKQSGSAKRIVADADSPPPRVGFLAALGGGVAAMVMAVVSTLLLLVNGSVTLLLFGLVSTEGVDWLNQKGVTQFGLFTIPLVMLVFQWMIWDYVSGVFSRESTDVD